MLHSAVAVYAMGDESLSWVGAINAGLLVAFGTRLGSGCTSGHGLCGISRFSERSTIATTLFMLTGIMSSTVISRNGFMDAARGPQESSEVGRYISLAVGVVFALGGLLIDKSRWRDALASYTAAERCSWRVWP
jgi:uncharacterized membrane protein YedE/YeeE